MRLRLLLWGAGAAGLIVWLGAPAPIAIVVAGAVGLAYFVSNTHK